MERLADQETRNKLVEQLKELEANITELEQWLNSHKLFHPDYDAKYSHRNNLRWKVEQITDRLTRKLENVEDTHSLPKRV